MFPTKKLQSSVLSGLALLSANAFALNNAQNLQAAYDSALKTNPSVASTYAKLLKATGYVRMVDSDPIQESKAQNGLLGLSFTHFKQLGCSFVHFKAPAYLVGSAVCFSDGEGRLDPFRRYARVFMQGKAYNVDPLSIIIHPNFRRDVSDNDLVVFSVEKDQEADFDKNFEPIDVLSETDWISEGQSVTVVGHGTTKDGDDATKLDFGTAHFKQFFQSYPDPQDMQRASESLSLSPEEHLLTFRTRNGEKGVNCTADSGGGSFTELNYGGDRPNKLVLQSIVIGKVSGKGDTEVACQDTDRYVVGVDLRHYTKFLESAPAEITRRRAETAQIQAAYKTGLKLYTQPIYDLFLPMLKDDVYSLFDKQHPNAHPHDRNQRVYAFMQREAKRLSARAFLQGTSAQKIAIANEWTKLDEPLDPWVPVGGNWVQFSRKAGKKVEFINPKGTDPLTRILIRNIGTEPVSFSAYKEFAGNSQDSKGKQKRTLQPGQSTEIAFSRFYGHTRYPNWSYQIESLDFDDLEGEPSLRIDGQLASPHQVAQHASTERQIAAQEKADEEYRARVRAEEIRTAKLAGEFTDGVVPSPRADGGVPVYIWNSTRRNQTITFQYLPVGKRGRNDWITEDITVGPTGGKKKGPYFYTDNLYYYDGREVQVSGNAWTAVGTGDPLELEE